VSSESLTEPSNPSCGQSGHWITIVHFGRDDGINIPAV
jgi:hypothetical protein